jgi:hypothetical protein
MKVLREGVKDSVAIGGRKMRTAIGSDERSELTDALVAELQERGHDGRIVKNTCRLSQPINRYQITVAIRAPCRDAAAMKQNAVNFS